MDERSDSVRRHAEIRTGLEEYFTVCLGELVENVQAFVKREFEQDIQIIQEDEDNWTRGMQTTNYLH
jgi:hypothetical protein